MSFEVQAVSGEEKNRYIYKHNVYSKYAVLYQTSQVMLLVLTEASVPEFPDHINSNHVENRK